MDYLTLPGVFRPISDSYLLAAAVGDRPAAPGERSLDLCTGSGVVAVAAAEAGYAAAAVDVSRRALVSTWWNARRRGHRVALRRGHLFDPTGAARFDLVTANPPYVPSPDDDLPRRGPARAWEAGPDGRAVLDEICDRAPGHLAPGGVLLLVQSSLCDEDGTLERLRAAGFSDAAVAHRARGPLGPLMRAQQAVGTVPATIDEEEVLVVRAVAPG